MRNQNKLYAKGIMIKRYQYVPSSGVSGLVVNVSTTLPFSEKSLESCAIAVQPRILFWRTPNIAFNPSALNIGGNIEFHRTSRKNVVFKESVGN